MKTRVIQNEPETPVAQERPADQPAKQRNKFAGRLARWARSTAKTAIFGWLVIVAFGSWRLRSARRPALLWPIRTEAG